MSELRESQQVKVDFINFILRAAIIDISYFFYDTLYSTIVLKLLTQLNSSTAGLLLNISAFVAMED